jgi:hypothetical protein
MHNYREARGEGSKMTRLTLFPASGKRIQVLISSYNYNEHGMLYYTDGDGIRYETTLPFAIEHTREGHRSPFSDK